MQFMLGRTRVRILAHAARCGDSSQSNNDADKRTFYCIPCEEPREENIQNKANYFVIKKRSSCPLSAFFSKDSDLGLAFNLVMATSFRSKSHLYRLGCFEALIF
jgi:hypothetical protein